ncbi:hypothetical protein GCM10020358_07660 [Amorphoplanes nipponensis]|uniref:Uncharacterized protein n=1 Tax=Actinoplanes nipponensis TaxID=135950 RepID=A0A919MN47_9ACTN|nr:hypothetical protein Ani05nite_16120 [Actinoplanes nipponensis]
MLVQGDVIPRASATIIFIVTGTVGGLNEDFKSIHTFDLDGNRETIQSEWFQTISLDRRDQREWANFDGTQLIYVFLHDTMMHSDSLTRAGLQHNRVGPAAISGYRRFWSPVPAEASNGSVLASGLAPSSGNNVHGLVVIADYLQLAHLDRSRLIGERSDVTRRIIWPPGAEPPQPFRVFSYVVTSPHTIATARYSRRRMAAAFRRREAELSEAASQVGDDCEQDVAAFLEGSEHQIRRLAR